MTICGSQSCACALRSDTLTITGSGTPSSPWVIEQVGFTDLTALQVAVDNLEASVDTLFTDVTALQTLTAAHTTAISRLDAMQSGQSSVATGTTSGTTPLVLDTATLTTLPVAGVLAVWGAVLFTKTVSSDVFSVTARINTSAGAGGGQDRTGAAVGWSTAMAGPLAVSAATAPTVDVVLTRASGTGTATVSSSYLRWLFLPS